MYSMCMYVGKHVWCMYVYMNVSTDIHIYAGRHALIGMQVGRLA